MLVQGLPVEIVGGFWKLGSDPYPLFLFRGRQHGTIFEGGTGSMGPVLGEQLKALGVDGAYVKQAVVTHAHPDHVMAVPLFREMFPGVSILASATAAQTLSAEKALSFFGKMDDMLTDSLIRAGVVTEQQRRPQLAQPRFGVDRILAEGDTVEVDEGVAFRVYATPGHSDCSLSFHEPRNKILIVSDATGYYIPKDGCWWPNYFTGYGTYVRSIERLAELEADVLCLSHNAVIRGADDVAAYFRGALDATRQYHERIVREAQSGKQVRAIAEALGAEVYAKTPLLPLDFFQKNCGLLVKNSLAHAGITAP